MQAESDSIAALVILRDVLKAFSKLTNDLQKIAEKHGMELSEIQNMDVSPSALLTLIQSSSNENVGLLVKGLAEIGSIQEDMASFMSYDADRLDTFNSKLKSIVSTLDKALGDGRVA